MSYHTLSGSVATEPFKKNSMTSTVVKGVAVLDQKVTLTGLMVLFPGKVKDLEVKAGDMVYVTGEQCVQPWAKKVIDINGTPFILVPVDNIVLVNTTTNPSSPWELAPATTVPVL